MVLYRGMSAKEKRNKCQNCQIELSANLDLLGFPHFITALHVMQTRYSEENSVRPSVCPSHA